MRGSRILYCLSAASLIALIALCVLWEGYLAPLKPGGSMLTLKVLPLLLPLFGILRGKPYTYQWASMMIFLYFIEGVVRAWSEHGLSSTLAQIEIVLSLMFFFCSIYFVRSLGKPAA